MTMTYDDPTVTAYLDRLRVAGSHLPADEREDLWRSVTEHLEEASARGDDSSDVLARLGTPEEIVAAAAGTPAPVPVGSGYGGGAYAGGPVAPAYGLSPGAVPAQPEPRMRARDIWALVLLQLGALALVVGWVVGLALLWSSDRWKWWEKALASLVWPGGLAGWMVVFGGAITWQTSADCPTAPDTVGTQSCSSGGGLGLPTGLFAAIVMLAPIAITIYLAMNARPRRGLQ